MTFVRAKVILILLLSFILFSLNAKDIFEKELASVTDFLTSQRGEQVLQSSLMLDLMEKLAAPANHAREMRPDRLLALLLFHLREDGHRRLVEGLFLLQQEVQKRFEQKGDVSLAELEDFLSSRFSLGENAHKKPIILKTNLNPIDLRKAVVQVLGNKVSASESMSTSLSVGSPSPAMAITTYHLDNPDGKIPAIEIASTRQLQQYAENMDLSPMSFSPSGHYIAGMPVERVVTKRNGQQVYSFVRGGNLQVWDSLNGRLTHIFGPPRVGHPQNIFFGADEKSVIVVFPHQAISYPLVGPRTPRVFHHPSSLPGEGFTRGEISPNNKMVALVSEPSNQVLIFDWAERRLIRTLQVYEQEIKSVHFNSTGSELYILPLDQEDPVGVWEPRTGHHYLNLELPLGAGASCIDVDKNGKWVAIGTSSGNVYLYDHWTGSLLTVLRTPIIVSKLRGVKSLTFDPEGKTLLATYYSHQLAVWN
ncbi:MAG: hypothetical protein WCG27_10940, partial [Pseudomonadota bacterium]